MVAVGLIDILARKCAPWSIKALIHFSRDDLHLFRQDTNYNLTEEDKEIQILGGPMPALFPMLLRRFQKKSDDESRMKQMTMLM